MIRCRIGCTISKILGAASLQDGECVVIISCPMTIEMRVAEPTPIRVPNAVARFMTGKVTAIPLTTLGSLMACPMTTLSMML